MSSSSPSLLVSSPLSLAALMDVQPPGGLSATESCCTSLDACVAAPDDVPGVGSSSGRPSVCPESVDVSTLVGAWLERDGTGDKAARFKVLPGSTGYSKPGSAGDSSSGSVVLCKPVSPG